MSIMQNGVDVTESVMAKAHQNAVREKRNTDDFLQVRRHLYAAKDALANQPRPWMNDCIYNSMLAIDMIIGDLEKDVS